MTNFFLKLIGEGVTKTGNVVMDTISKYELFLILHHIITMNENTNEHI